MCHQTVSLTARALEAAGIPTVSMGCAKDIVEYVGVPRFWFSDFPLGNAAGRPHDKESQLATLRGALAFLESAEQVHLVTVNPEKDLDVPCADLAEHLARHGVNVEVESAFAYRQDVGKQILSLAQTFESDMMVMGLYGHMRLAEFMFGGVTRYVIENTKIPVLFSHYPIHPVDKISHPGPSRVAQQKSS